MANVISCIRILCGVVLAFCNPFSKLFYALYTLGGISDILDGYVARHFGKETGLGAKLDTIADVLFVIVVLQKVFAAVFIPTWLIIWVIVIAIIKCINIVSGFVCMGHFVTEHTVLNKVCGALLFAIPLCVNKFPWQSVAILIILTGILATIAAVQEGHYIRIGEEIK